MGDEADVLAAEDVFAYTARKDGTVHITWRGKPVTVLAGREAARFLARVVDAEAREAQLAMAKATGNFRRGNERRPTRP